MGMHRPAIPGCNVKFVAMIPVIMGMNKETGYGDVHSRKHHLKDDLESFIMFLMYE